MTTAAARMSPAAERYAEECLKLSADAATHVRVLRNIAYGGDPRQRMDIFLPLDADLRALPVLLFMHGGAWTHGTKDWCGFMAPPIALLPAIFVSVGYRLIPHVSFPEPVMDCIEALRWMSDHIAECISTGLLCQSASQSFWPPWQRFSLLRRWHRMSRASCSGCSRRKLMPARALRAAWRC